MFRDLKADEIDVRVQSVTEKGAILLLYKDARCDMNILDETVTPMGWKREHARDNANCIVSIWDENKKEWISKEDTGTESNTEKEKGQASDSFKRACFNWGIGRELYTSPFLWVGKADLKSHAPSGGKAYKTYDKFEVVDIVIEDKRIVDISIKNTATGKTVIGKAKAPSRTPSKAPSKGVNKDTVIDLITKNQVDFFNNVAISKNKKEEIKEIMAKHGVTQMKECPKNKFNDLLAEVQAL